MLLRNSVSARLRASHPQKHPHLNLDSFLNLLSPEHSEYCCYRHHFTWEEASPSRAAFLLTLTLVWNIVFPFGHCRSSELFLVALSFIWSVSTLSTKTRSARRAQYAHFVYRDSDAIREQFVSAIQILHWEFYLCFMSVKLPYYGWKFILHKIANYVTKLNQQSAQPCFLDVYVRISHWTFLRF